MSQPWSVLRPPPHLTRATHKKPSKFCTFFGGWMNWTLKPLWIHQNTSNILDLSMLDVTKKQIEWFYHQTLDFTNDQWTDLRETFAGNTGFDHQLQGLPEHVPLNRFCDRELIRNNTCRLKLLIPQKNTKSKCQRDNWKGLQPAYICVYIYMCVCVLFIVYVLIVHSKSQLFPNMIQCVQSCLHS